MTTKIEWRPIEEAPEKHGSKFLVFVPTNDGGDYYTATRFNDSLGNEIHVLGDYDRSIRLRPTHFAIIDPPDGEPRA